MSSTALDLHPSGRLILDAISPIAWEHPTDRAALASLQQIPGFDGLLKKIVGMFGEKNIATIYTAAAVRVGPAQYPGIHEALVRVCEVLDTEVPPLYISQTPLANAGAVGMDHPFIVLNSTIVELASPEEMEVVLGHEVGHIMSEHSLYRTLLFLLLDMSSRVMPIVSQAIIPITLALLEWSRKAEISCDRAGLLAVQDLDAAMGMHAVLAGGIRGQRDQLNLEAFVEQADEYRNLDGLSAYYRLMATLGRSHDFPVIRVAELRNWVDSGAYAEILDGNYHRVGDPHSTRADITTAGRNFSERAGQVFEDTDRYVNDALTNFMTSAKRIFDDSI
ncbi:MAG: M48 family metallopeptidase [Acidimicrobiia bacterium]|nr:M48 family metallopeptidase [Acidimicrobiia bacterium]